MPEGDPTSTARSGRLKGSMFLSTFAFAEARFGRGARQKLLEALPRDDRAVLSGIVLPIQWYPLPLFVRLLNALETTYGEGDFALVTERGRWTAVNDMRTLRRAFAKIVTYEWLMAKANSLWPQFHDTGEWHTRKLGPKSVVATLRGLGSVDPALCASIRGWLIGLGELTGVKSHVRHTRCRSSGALACDYNIDWV